jgi:hypothetical protein
VRVFSLPIVCAPIEYRDLDPFGFLGYRVGSDGTVWSSKSGKWKGMGPHSWGNRGHQAVILRRDGKRYYLLVHRLILLAFVGPCPPGMEARHVYNPDPRDNRLINLAWGTPKENQADRLRHGTDCRGSKHPLAILTEADIPEIFRLRAQGLSQDQLAERFNVTRYAISRILQRKIWTHIAIRPTDLAGAEADTIRGRKLSASFNASQINEMRRLYSSGLSYEKIAPLFGVAAMTVWRAITGRTKYRNKDHADII